MTNQSAHDRSADANVRVSGSDLIGLRGRMGNPAMRQRRPARAQLTGVHRATLPGRGMDYRESRHYQNGDDIRFMDWRVSARTGRAHIKLFEQERERPVVVLVDFSPSMFFASRGAFKSVVAARLAAAIGWSAVDHGDRIGGLLFNGVHRELAPAGGRRGGLALVHRLVAAGDPDARFSHPPDDGDGTGGKTGLLKALERLHPVVRAGSLVILISDFYGLDAAADQHLRSLSRHNRVVACRIADPLELAPPPNARYGISDGRRRRLLDLGDQRVRDQYLAHVRQLQEATERMAAAHHMPLVGIHTTDDTMDALQRLHDALRGVPGTGREAA